MLASAGLLPVMLALFGIGVFGGLFIVPLYALLQVRGEPAHRARIIAANNILNALFMVVGSLAAGALLGAGLTIPRLFLLAALLNGVVCILLCLRAPDFLLASRNWLRRKPGEPSA